MDKSPEESDYGLDEEKISIVNRINVAKSDRESAFAFLIGVVCFALAIFVYANVFFGSKKLGGIGFLISFGGGFIVFGILASLNIFHPFIDWYFKKLLTENKISKIQFDNWDENYTKYLKDLNEYELKQFRAKKPWGTFEQYTRSTYRSKKKKQSSTSNYNSKSSATTTKPTEKNTTEIKSENSYKPIAKTTPIAQPVKKEAPTVEVENPFGTQFGNGEHITTNLIKQDLFKQYVSFSKAPEDFITDALNKQNIGLLGEQFVMEMEKKKLIKSNNKDLVDFVEQVSKTKGDSLGYDIVSYNEKREKILIEVKTTVGNIYSPFYMTDNEKNAFFENNNYNIYRVFNFDTSTLTGKVFIIDDKIKFKEFFISAPIMYKIVPKKMGPF